MVLYRLRGACRGDPLHPVRSAKLRAARYLLSGAIV